jgi:hypothetical protein
MLLSLLEIPSKIVHEFARRPPDVSSETTGKFYWERAGKGM